MKGFVALIAMVASASVVAVTPDYDSCLNDNSSEVCQAYLAGLNQGKSATVTAANIEPESTFRSRALEQRVGERARKMALIERKDVPSAN
ncbi:hypothetical protein C9I98_14085 [Photobacterium sanctipauli]|uniref:Uncharacterized protein n=1 Tax=Photobacterium sanctipauli TaxID=1342794 RepID=A0A2T3NRY1_9GAMM|nr:hypothetical protein [Photobacterium sanctipauli]PSW18975.1 hypothetical protein C9I98_14085 [Photobacterium sanctipauli]